MAAYASVVSLMNTLELIRNHYRLRACLGGMQIESLRSRLEFLQDFLGEYSCSRDLETQIAEIAYAAEDLIESHVADQILRNSNLYSGRFKLLDLQRVKQDMDSMEERVEEILRLTTVKRKYSELIASSSMAPGKYSKLVANSSMAPGSYGKISMVGFDNELLQIMERLTGGQSLRQVIPIVGMGGIGKTTLAQSVYEKPLIAHFYDIRIWISVSQEYTLRDLLLQIPICQKEQEDSECLVTEHQLGEVLFKSLFGKRYLIIMDDVWNIKVWNDVHFYFPDNHNISRIIITTRLSNVATHFGSFGFKMNFLDEEKSWKLFCKVSFGQEACPPELEEVARMIVQRCKGLPLSIVVTGGLLKRSHGTHGCWDNVANQINSILNLEDDEHCQNVLLLSYEHLPIHLKPCFLYMGIFHVDHEIHVSHLIRLWVAEGFLKLGDDDDWEEIADKYLKDLVDRNLILVRKCGLDGKIKTCSIHDLLRDLCLRRAQQEGCICVLKNHQQHPHHKCCIVLHERSVNNKHQPLSDVMESACFARTLMYSNGLPQTNGLLLRVLDTIDIKSFGDISHQVNLRYIRCRFTSIPRSFLPISLLWNVQTIICQNNFPVFAPSEIWMMKQLRHVEFYEICLPVPPLLGVANYFTLRNLCTLMKVGNFKFSTEISTVLPCIKKLQIKCVEPQEESKMGLYYHGLEHLCHLSMLESLKVSFYVKKSVKFGIQGCLTYPISLKKLTLDNIELCWNDLAKIGSLPNLVELKLKGSIGGSTWNPIEEGFRSLKSLRIIGYVDLIYWNADRSHFPVLEILNLGGVPYLDAIPLDIGCIPTLKVIHFYSSRAKTAISAMKILVERESYGDEDLQVRVTFINEVEKGRFLEMVEMEGLTSDNFTIETRA